MCEIIERNRAEGREEGREEGRAEGLAKGLAKGRIEERTNLVVSMLKNKMKPEQIAQIAQMTVEQIVAIGQGGKNSCYGLILCTEYVKLALR